MEPNMKRESIASLALQWICKALSASCSAATFPLSTRWRIISFPTTQTTALGQILSLSKTPTKLSSPDASKPSNRAYSAASKQNRLQLCTGFARMRDAVVVQKKRSNSQNSKSHPEQRQPSGGNVFVFNRIMLPARLPVSLLIASQQGLIFEMTLLRMLFSEQYHS